MRRLVPSLALVGLGLAIGSLPLAAQEEAPDPYVRESFWKFSFADMERWNGIYTEYVVPVLDQMQAEGMIVGYSASQHSAGGDYSWRFALICPDWASIDAALQTINNRMAAAGAPNLGELVTAHTDQIWQLTSLEQREEAPPNQYLYIASFSVKPAELEFWNTFFEEVWAPALRGAMEAGLLNGFAVEEHAHGGDMNWQILYLLPDWDSADDAWDAAFAAFDAHPEGWERVTRAILAHEDNIWQTLSVETGN